MSFHSQLRPLCHTNRYEAIQFSICSQNPGVAARTIFSPTRVTRRAILYCIPPIPGLTSPDNTTAALYTRLVALFGFNLHCYNSVPKTLELCHVLLFYQNLYMYFKMVLSVYQYDRHSLLCSSHLLSVL